jgi:excisionase family DNA binding protein
MASKGPRGKKRSNAGISPQTPKSPLAPMARQDGDRLAITTGQAAKHCLVSSDTIANWIAAGRLAAQRTVGGQYRIRVADLRCFMRSHGMRTDLLDVETGHKPACWEFWAVWVSGRRDLEGAAAGDPGGLVGGVCATCADCPVYRGRAAVCHELRPLLPGGTQRAQSCADCQFLSISDEHPIEEQ